MSFLFYPIAANLHLTPNRLHRGVCFKTSFLKSNRIFAMAVFLKSLILLLSCVFYIIEKCSSVMQGLCVYVTRRSPAMSLVFHFFTPTALGFLFWERFAVSLLSCASISVNFICVRVCLLVCLLPNFPTTCQRVSGMDLLRQMHVLRH